MSDRRDDLIRRSAELADRSLRARSIAAELTAESEELASRLAETRKAAARVMRLAAETMARARLVRGNRRPSVDGGAARPAVAADPGHRR